MKAFLTLLRSEHLEHRGGQFWTPVIVGALILILLIVATLHQGSMIINLTMDNSEVTIRTVEDAHRAIRDEVGEERVGPVLQSLAYGSNYVGLLPIMLIAVVVSYFLLVGSMHNERADRSVLFWKSMPVSDLKVTLAKFVSSTFGTLFIATLVGVGVMVIGMVIYAVAGPLSTAPEWRAASHPAVAASTVLLALTLCVFYVLWAAPVYGWILLASAWAPRSPLLYVAVPPVAIGILEAMTTRDRSWLWHEIGSRVSGSMLNVDIPLGDQVHSASGLSNILFGQIGRMAEGAANPRFWLGLALTALFIWAASEIRRRRIA